MKKIVTILLVFVSLATVAQNTHTQSNAHTNEQFQGAVEAKKGFINGHYADTTEANLTWVKDRPFIQIVTGYGILWIRDFSAQRWILQSGAGVQGSILNDSTFLLCNSNGCDTFTVQNITITSFSFTSDSTVQVCNSAGSCDTISFAPVPLNKFYVDSVLISNGANFDTLKYYVNGNAIIGGYIGGRYYNKDEIDSIFAVTLQNYYTQTQIDSLNTIYGVTNNSNRIISGGIVTWSGTGLTYYVSACTYQIGGVIYNSPDTTITLTAADATNPRIDLFAVDTLNRALKITGVAASVPLAPQIDPSSQLALTTGINLPANAATPTGTTSTAIYDENTEWTTGGTATVDYNNTANPYHGTKDAYVSYTKNQTLTFTGTNQTVNGQTLRAFISLNNSNYNFQFQFFNGATAVSNNLTLSGYSPTLYNVYQNISIPLTAFSWSATTFNKLVITMTGRGGTGTYYIDYISLEGGTTVVPPQTDYSYKVDSVTRIAGSYYYWAKGIKYLISVATDSLSFHTASLNSDSTQLSLIRPNGTKDTIPLPFVKKTDTTVIKVHYPVWAFSSDSLGLRTDSMPKLEYAIAGRDTSTWDNYTLIDKQFLQDRISTVTATGITRTELQDTAAAIRADFPTGDVWGSITGTLSDQTDLQSALDAKQNAITLTTTGTSGAATLTGSTLNIPQYSGGSGGGIDSVRQTLGSDTIKQYSSGVGTKALLTRRVFNVKDYGAKGDGVTSDQSAIQAAIDACYDAGGGIVYFPNGTYRLGDTLVTSGTLIGNPNSLLYIKQRSATDSKGTVSINFEGEGTPDKLYSGLIGYSVKGNGPTIIADPSSVSGTFPSILGADPGASGGFGFNLGVDVNISNLKFEVKNRTGLGPNMSGLNLSKIGNAIVNNCVIIIDTALIYSSFPTLETFGVWMPDNNNSTTTIFRSSVVGGFKYGVIAAEHFKSEGSEIAVCDYGIVFKPTTHGVHIDNIGIQWCRVSVSGAVGSLGGNGLTKSFLTIDALNDEYRADGHWFDTRYIVGDSTNQLRGEINYVVVASGSGGDYTKFSKLGGDSINCYRIGDLGSSFLHSITIQESSSTGNASLNLNNDLPASNSVLRLTGSATTIIPNTLTLMSGSNNIALLTDDASPSGGTHNISFWTGGYSASQERMRIAGNGNIMMGQTTDSTSAILNINKSLSILGSATGAGNIFSQVKNNSTTGDARIIAANNSTGQVVMQATGDTYVSSSLYHTASIFTSGNISSLSFMTNGDVGSGGTSKINFIVGGYAETPTATFDRKKVGFGGITSPSAVVELAAGTTTTPPLKFNSGSSLTTPVGGAIEYNGSNFLLTTSSAIREYILTTPSVNNVSPTSPNRTLTIKIAGVTYYIPAKTTND